MHGCHPAETSANETVFAQMDMEQRSSNVKKSFCATMEDANKQKETSSSQTNSMYDVISKLV